MTDKLTISGSLHLQKSITDSQTQKTNIYKHKIDKKTNQIKVFFQEGLLKFTLTLTNYKPYYISYCTKSFLSISQLSFCN